MTTIAQEPSLDGITVSLEYAWRVGCHFVCCFSPEDMTFAARQVPVSKDTDRDALTKSTALEMVRERGYWNHGCPRTFNDHFAVLLTRLTKRLNEQLPSQWGGEVEGEWCYATQEFDLSVWASPLWSDLDASGSQSPLWEWCSTHSLVRRNTAHRTIGFRRLQPSPFTIEDKLSYIEQLAGTMIDKEAAYAHWRMQQHGPEITAAIAEHRKLTEAK